MNVRIRRFPLATAASALILGCGSDDVVSPVNNSAAAFWELRLDRSEDRVRGFPERQGGRRLHHA